jgi:spore coat polysaccharide biosynthesis protein SpsF
VVKIPSDCPLIDPDTIDRVIGAFLAEDDVDYASNLHPPTWPDGFDVEVMTRGALETAWREATRPLDREHTTPFLWDNPERFTTLNVPWQTGLDYSQSHRLVLDYPEDYAVIRAVYDELWSAGRTFTLDDILTLLDARPALAAINAVHRGTSWIQNHLGELKTLAHGGMP